jgi:hypothetical protein
MPLFLSQVKMVAAGGLGFMGIGDWRFQISNYRSFTGEAFGDRDFHGARGIVRFRGGFRVKPQMDTDEFR